MKYNIMGDYDFPKPLSKEETIHLLAETKNGSKKACDKLVLHNMRLVIDIVIKKFKNTLEDPNDLCSFGTIGLLKAIKTYDCYRKTAFSTYASICIQNEILMWLRSLSKNKNVFSLEQPIFSNDSGQDFNLKETLSTQESITENYETTELYNAIRNLVEVLPDREKEMVKMYFGFCDDQIYSQREIALKFNLSQSYVSRIILKTVKEIKEALQNQGLIELRNKEKIKKIDL